MRTRALAIGEGLLASARYGVRLSSSSKVGPTRVGPLTLADMPYFSLRTLAAPESSILLGLSPFGGALLADLLLGERLTGLQVTGLVVAAAGVVLAQWRRA